MARPERAHRAVIDGGLAVALDFDHSGGLVGRLHRQAGQPEGEFILRELDLLPGLEQRAESTFGLSPPMATTTSGL